MICLWFIFRVQWSEETLALAMNSVLNKQMSKQFAAKYYGIPYSTLGDYIKKGSASKRDFGRHPILTAEVENELVTYIMSYKDKGITRLEIMSLAFQFAESHGIKHNFSQKSKMAGESWYASFLKRHPSVSVKLRKARQGQSSD